MRVYDKPKHKDFDKYWAKMENLVYWKAEQLKDHFHNVEPRDIFGFLTLEFNRLLYRYKPGKKAKFSSYFCTFASADKFWEIFLRKDRQYLDLHKMSCTVEYYPNYKDFRRIRYDEHVEPDFDSRWLNEDTFWQAIGEMGLSERQRYILVSKYRDGRTLKEIGEEFGVTKSAMQQQHVAALKYLQSNTGMVTDVLNRVSDVHIRSSSVNQKRRRRGRTRIVA